MTDQTPAPTDRGRLVNAAVAATGEGRPPAPAPVNAADLSPTSPKGWMERLLDELGSGNA
jgi:hypothetical protein